MFTIYYTVYTTRMDLQFMELSLFIYCLIGVILNLKTKICCTFSAPFLCENNSEMFPTKKVLNSVFQCSMYFR